MSRNRLLILIVVILTCLNVALVLHTMLADKPLSAGELTHEGNGGPRDLIIERLHFNEDQIQAYDALIKEHRRNVSDKEKQIREWRAQLFEALGESDAFDKSVAAKIGNLQQEMEQIHVQHFLQIKALCTEEQMPYFNAMTSDLAHLFAPSPKGHRGMHPPRP